MDVYTHMLYSNKYLLAQFAAFTPALTKQIFVKFGTGDLNESLLRKVQIQLKSDKNKMELYMHTKASSCC